MLPNERFHEAIRKKNFEQFIDDLALFDDVLPQTDTEALEMVLAYHEKSPQDETYLKMLVSLVKNDFCAKDENKKERAVKIVRENPEICKRTPSWVTLFCW